MSLPRPIRRIAPEARQAVPRAPGHLGKAGKALWRAVMTDQPIDEGHSREQLAIACEAADRAAEARAAIVRDGAYIDGRFGIKAHPALAVERDARIRQLRALRELGLDLESPSESSRRPPTPWRCRSR